MVTIPPPDVLTQPEWNEVNQNVAKKIRQTLKSQYSEMANIVIRYNQLSTKTLSFYPELKLLRISRFNKTKDELYFLAIGNLEKLFYLDGSSSPIHYLNSKGLIHLQPENVQNYLQFFCFFVHTDNGPFYIINRNQVQDISNNLQNELGEADQSKHAAICSVGSFYSSDENDYFLIKAPVVYANRLFEADFLIKNHGQVDMLVDRPLDELNNVDVDIPNYPKLTPITANSKKEIEEKQTNDRHYKTRQAAKRSETSISSQENLIPFIDIDSVKQQAEICRDDAKQLYQGIINKFGNNQGCLPFACISKSKVNDLANSLSTNFPHFSELTELIKEQLYMSVHFNNGRIYIPPIVIEGPAGVGKTFFIQELAKTLGSTFERLDCGALTAPWEISGSSTTWRGGKPGKVFQTIMNSSIINPFFCADEFDKLSSREDYNIVNVFYQLLETISARTFKDEAVNVPVNCEYIIWFATCNDYHKLPLPIQSRMQRVYVGQPKKEHTINIVQSIYTQILAENRWEQYFSHHIAENIADVIAEKELSPRLTKRLIHNACIKAALLDIEQHESMKNEIELTVKDLSFLHMPKERTIGFI